VYERIAQLNRGVKDPDKSSRTMGFPEVRIEIVSGMAHNAESYGTCTWLGVSTFKVQSSELSNSRVA